MKRQECHHHLSTQGMSHTMKREKEKEKEKEKEREKEKEKERERGGSRRWKISLRERGVKRQWRKGRYLLCGEREREKGRK